MKPIKFKCRACGAIHIINKNDDDEYEITMEKGDKKGDKGGENELEKFLREGFGE